MYKDHDVTTQVVKTLSKGRSWVITDQCNPRHVGHTWVAIGIDAWSSK